jgi:hypothetical protein
VNWYIESLGVVVETYRAAGFYTGPYFGFQRHEDGSFQIAALCWLLWGISVQRARKLTIPLHIEPEVAEQLP